MSTPEIQSKSRVPNFPEDHLLRSDAQKYFSKLGNNKVYNLEWTAEKKTEVENQWIFIKECFETDLKALKDETGFSINLNQNKIIDWSTMFKETSIYYTIGLRNWEQKEFPTEFHMTISGFATESFPKFIGCIVAYLQFMCTSPVGVYMHLFDKWKDAKFEHIIKLSGDSFSVRFSFLLDGIPISCDLKSYDNAWTIGKLQENGYFDVTFKQDKIFGIIANRIVSYNRDLGLKIRELSKTSADMIVTTKELSRPFSKKGLSKNRLF